MLYKKESSETLDMKLFENPSSEYRAAPFWAWNCELKEEELLWQIEQLKQMGFGGFYMHTRSGMATKYLSDDYMQLIKSCTQKAKEENMLAYLYDEDRWPSGAAGGLVTKNYPEFRQRRLLFTVNKLFAEPMETAIKNGTPYLLGIYDVVLNKNGQLEKYRMIENEEQAEGIVRYAYVEVRSSFDKSPGWYNGGTYVDTLNKKAMEKFVEITHERYKSSVGSEFGKTVPAMFTDEPQFSHYQNLPTAQSDSDAVVPWTPDIEESFYDAFGYSIKEKLPELFWELDGSKVSVARYNFHDHVCERFANAFSDTCGNWCKENGIALTGHLYGEYTLGAQTKSSGEAMRSYRSLQLPGVDMLFNNHEYSTVKQVQSAVRQYGREGGMSECYGVTNWDFDFRAHKAQGDWQAAMGITMRVPHLSWVSMKGVAKRDYPASINYQSPWYKEYKYIEDYLSRITTVLTRGKPCVSVGVIHPIESYWLHYGPENATSAMRESIDKKFDDIVKWLLFDTVDFDFIRESSLPELGSVNENGFCVGKMAYSVIVVPDCETLRTTTVEMLEKFLASGGRVIFAGTAPKYIDAVPNNRASALYDKSEKVPFDKFSITKALETERVVEIEKDDGKNPEQFIYQLRKDTDADYLFIANAEPAHNIYHNYATEPPCKVEIKIKGEYSVVRLDAFSGKAEPIGYEAKDGITVVNYDFYENDSLLLRLVPCKNDFLKVRTPQLSKLSQTDFKTSVCYKRHEDNVCLLDLAEYALDDGDFEDTEEILRIDKKLREKFLWPLASGQDMQPWAIEKEKCVHTVTLRFSVNVLDRLENTFFCAEELSELVLNGEKVNLKEAGYFVDKSIKKCVLPALPIGENTILAKIPFAKEESLEACYLTGDFSVALSGCEKTLSRSKERIGFGDIVSQGMPFYSGNITYTEKITVPESCVLCVNIANYKGALTKVSIDGEEVGNIVFAPYDLYVENISAGEHTIQFTLFGNRHNTFGGLHNCGISVYYGQGYWYSTDNSWSYEYNLKPTGILKSPVITLYKQSKTDK